MVHGRSLQISFHLAKFHLKRNIKAKRAAEMSYWLSALVPLSLDHLPEISCLSVMSLSASYNLTNVDEWSEMFHTDRFLSIFGYYANSQNRKWQNRAERGTWSKKFIRQEWSANCSICSFLVAKLSESFFSPVMTSEHTQCWEQHLAIYILHIISFIYVCIAIKWAKRCAG